MDGLVKRIIRSFSGDELLKIGNRSYINSLRYPESRFDPDDLPTLYDDPPMLQPLQDPLRRFSDQIVIHPSYLIFKVADKTYAKNGITGQIEYCGVNSREIIQKAINSLPSGGIVFIKSGVYVIADTYITLKSYITIEGEGYGTLIWNTKVPDLTIFAYGPPGNPLRNIVVRNIRVKVDEPSADGISLGGDSGVTDSIIENNYVEGVGEEGIEIIGACKRIIVKNNIVNGMGSGWNPQIDAFIHLDYGTLPEDIIIDGNVTMNSVNACGISVMGNRIRVVNNIVNNPYSRCINVYTVSGYPINHILIEGNIMTGDPNNYDIVLKISGRSDAWISYVTVRGNHINVAGSSGIMINYARYICVSSNIVYYTGRAGWGAGIHVMSHYGNIVNNLVLDCGARSPSAPGIYLAGTYIRVANNFIRGSGSAGIFEDTGGNYNIIENNDVRGNCVISGTPIIKTGTNTLVRYNIGYTTENRGRAIFSGDGSRTTFNIPHGLAGTPISWRVEAGSPDATGTKYVTADATNLVVTFVTPPPAGTNNVVLVWQAEI